MEVPKILTFGNPSTLQKQRKRKKTPIKPALR
jgi:hypothetical protein